MRKQHSVSSVKYDLNTDVQWSIMGYNIRTRQSQSVGQRSKFSCRLEGFFSPCGFGWGTEVKPLGQPDQTSERMPVDPSYLEKQQESLSLLLIMTVKCASASLSTWPTPTSGFNEKSNKKINRKRKMQIISCLSFR